jgi:hypothetical protein
MHQRWTEEEDALARTSLPTKEVARRLNRTAAAVDQRRRRLRSPAGGYAAMKDWRNRNRDTWNGAKRRNYEKGAAHQHNAHRHWTKQEDQAIMAPDRPRDRELARVLGRTVQAIQVRRTRLSAPSRPLP